MTATLKIYFAGSLFSNKDLIGNALLAEAIESVSDSRYKCLLPQDFEQREITSASIRNQDLRMVATSDLGIFNFDGTELDSGTVVEYMLAKFMDIPSVIIRTDFRRSGDDQDYPWNLMLSNFPRTKVVSFNAMELYQSELPAENKLIQAQKFSLRLAEKIVVALDQVYKEPAILKGIPQKVVYEWVRHFAGAGFEKVLSQEMIECLQSK